MTLPAWLRIFVKLKQRGDQKSIRIVKIVNLLAVFTDEGLGLDVLLGEAPEFCNLASKTPLGNDHEELEFVRHNSEWPAVFKSLIHLPFIHIDRAYNDRDKMTIRLQRPFRHYLQHRIQKDSLEDAYWTIMSALLLDRYTPSRIIVQCRFVGPIHLNSETRTLQRHVLENLSRIPKVLGKNNLLLLRPSARLSCILYFISWSQFRLDDGIITKEYIKVTLSTTKSLLERLFGDCPLDPLLKAILRLHGFCLFDELSRDLGLRRQYWNWVASAADILNILENLNENRGAVMASFLPANAIDTLLDMVFCFVDSVSNGLRWAYNSGVHPSHLGENEEEKIQANRLKGEILEEAHSLKISTMMPLTLYTSDSGYLSAVATSQNFHCYRALCNLDEEIHEYQRKCLPFVIHRLPIVLTLEFLVSFFSMAPSSLGYQRRFTPMGFGDYYNIMKELFRARDRKIYECYKPYHTVMDEATVNGIAPLLYKLTKYSRIYPDSTYFEQAESIAAHNFLAGRNFHTWSLTELHRGHKVFSQSFKTLCQLYSKAQMFREAGVLASTYLALFQISNPPIDLIGWGIHECIKTLVMCLDNLGHMLPFDCSVVREHVNHLHTNSRLQDRLDIGVRLAFLITWVHTVDSDETEGEVNTLLWEPGPENIGDIPLESLIEKQIYAWMNLVTEDDKFREARRKLVRSSSLDTADRIFKANDRLGIQKENFLKEGFNPAFLSRGQFYID
ncbi:hypothetical protein DFP73DRAFT_595578 [Morchella snyderi]|nr:hypothetical protein DFP73DRAFT_595578 [Morchella snyderi]